jgi:hypothetical protein
VTGRRASAPRPSAAAKPFTKPRKRGEPPIEEGDPRIEELLRAFEGRPKLAPIARAFKESKKTGGRKFGSNGLKVGTKLFALFAQGTLVVKLPSERVSALVAAGVGTPFDPGRGRLMKEWLKVTGKGAPWFALATEAYDYVSSG